MPRPIRSLGALRAAFGDDVFTARDLPASGVPKRTADWLAAQGHLERVGPLRYRIPSRATDSRSRYLAELQRLLAVHPHSAAAGVSAAAVRGLRCPDPWGDWSELPLTLASEQPLTPRPNLRRLLLPESDVEAVDGLRCTILAATAREIARQLPAPQALITIDHIARELAGTDDKRRLLGDKTRARAAAALEIAAPRELAARRTLAWADPAADSAPESYLRGHLLLAGVEPPKVNHPVSGASGRTYYPDLWWPNRHLVVEIDGRLKYKDDPNALYAEKRREDDLRAGGIDVERIVAAEVLAHAAAIAASFR